MRTEVRSFSTVLVIVLVCAFVPGCRTAAPPASPFGPGTEVIVEKTRAFDRAFANRDVRTLESMLAPDYTFHWIDHTTMGSMRPNPIAPRGRAFADMFVRLTGAAMQSSTIDARRIGDLGLVVTRYQWAGAWGDSSFSQEGYVTDIWVRRGHRWLLLVSYAQLMPAP